MLVLFLLLMSFYLLSISICDISLSTHVAPTGSDSGRTVGTLVFSYAHVYCVSPLLLSSLAEGEEKERKNGKAEPNSLSGLGKHRKASLFTRKVSVCHGLKTLPLGLWGGGRDE